MTAEHEREPLIESRRHEYVDSMVAYVKTHERYDELSKEDAMRELVSVMLDDIGAAQGFLHAIGVKVDLYGSS